MTNIGEGVRQAARRSQVAALCVFVLGATTGVGRSQGLKVELDVIDGDSLAVDFRLFGVDAPEGKQQCEREATQFLGTLLEEGSVYCLPTGKSSYGRPVVICRAGAVDFGEAMLEAGWGVVTPHVERRATGLLARYQGAQERARAQHKGVWSGASSSPTNGAVVSAWLASQGNRPGRGKENL